MPRCDLAGWPDRLTDPDAWEFVNERAAIAEFDAGLPRPEAERLALNALLDRADEKKLAATT